MIYREYKRPQSLEEAYTLYQKRNSLILAGTMWSRMSRRVMQTGIDLCDLDLEYIREAEDCIRIGAYTSLHDLEEHAGLAALTQGAMKEAVRHIVGVQFRNTATAGGSVWGRFGFSDIVTLFLALDASVILYHRGEVSLEEFLTLPKTERDILTEIRIPKKPLQIVYQSQRNQSVDLPVLTCAVAAVRESYGMVSYTAVIGARPMAAVRLAIPKHLVQSEAPADAIADYVMDQVPVAGNMRAGEAYRKQICGVLVKRAVRELEKRVEQKYSPDVRSVEEIQ